MEWHDIVALAAAFGAIAWLVWFIFTGNDDRADEDSARAFFDAHGHWPDEDPSQANRRYHL